MSRLATLGLALRSLLWTILLPGMVAAWIPWRYVGVSALAFNARDPLHWIGVIAVIKGAIILGVCIYEFAHSGRATLSPLDAPKALVVRGLYRYVRNPMYVGVVTVLLGYSLMTRTTAMWSYLATVFVGFNIFVLGYEQPALTRMFGQQYTRYRSAVPMWIPRLRPFHESD